MRFFLTYFCSHFQRVFHDFLSAATLFLSMFICPINFLGYAVMDVLFIRFLIMLVLLIEINYGI